MGDISLVAYEVQRAVGADVRSVKGLPVNADRERKRDSGGAIIAMVAGVRDSRHDGVPGRSAGEIATRCRRRRWAGQGVDEVCVRRHTSWRVGACGITPYLREVRRVLLHSYREGAIGPS